MVLVGLHLVEIAALAHLEAVVAVELEERRDARVLAGHALHARDGVAGLQHGAVPPVGEVEGLLSLPGVHDRVVARREGVALDHPDELLARVVEVQLQLVGRGRDGLLARELERLDQVLVRHLGELAALVRVQVDVVHVQRGGHQVGVGHTVADGVGVGRVLGRDVPAQVADVLELQVDAHLVVLERDEGQRKTRVAAEPELEGDVQRVLGGARDHLLRGVGLTGVAVAVAGLAALDEQVRELRDVAHHLGIAGLLARLLRELIPDLEPDAIVLVNALAANLNLDGRDEVVTDPVEPAELGARAVREAKRHAGKRGLEVHAVDQVAVALDRARHLAAEARGAVEGVLNGLHGEVRVAAVYHLEERDLGVARQVHVLGTVGYELHQTTTCHFGLYLFVRKKFSAGLKIRFFFNLSPSAGRLWF